MSVSEMGTHRWLECLMSWLHREQQAVFMNDEPSAAFHTHSVSLFFSFCFPHKQLNGLKKELNILYWKGCFMRTSRTRSKVGTAAVHIEITLLRNE